MIGSAEGLEPIINRLVTVLSLALDVDVAFIDKSSRLVACTKSYEKHKGVKVHSPFINEVMQQGVVMVTEPGRMNLCEGCRFQQDCPAKTELLGCLKIEREPIGVISLSSFSNEGGARLYNEKDKFLDLLNITSELVYEIYKKSFFKVNKHNGVSQTAFQQQNITLNDIKGESEIIRCLKEKAKLVAKSDATVLITGETGTGKELFARAIHSASFRQKFPFVPINCAGIPDTLLESELFGYEGGAFTGARKGGKKGKFELANGGTLFLDEIGDMSLDLQAKLLRVIQERIVERIGGLCPIPLDIRIIAATNKNLEEAIKENKFREDLYYRLNVIPFHIHPVRERTEDIETLAIHFLDKHKALSRKNINRLTPEALEVLKMHFWPGNAREIENTIEYALTMTTSKLIDVCSLPEKISSVARTHQSVPENANDGTLLKNKIRKAEYKTVVAALEKYGWSVKGKTKAAEKLGISLRTLYRILRDSTLNNERFASVKH